LLCKIANKKNAAGYKYFRQLMPTVHKKPIGAFLPVAFFISATLAYLPSVLSAIA
jgi:hypothetical protein